MANGKVLSLCPSMINLRNYAKIMGINARRLTRIILIKTNFTIIDAARGIENKLAKGNTS